MGKHVKPHLCYCQIPEDKLKELARLRYIDGIPTEELMARLKTPEERNYLAAIALLDVPAESLGRVVPGTEPGLLRHLFDCRYHVKSLLEEAGIVIEEKPV